MVLEPRMATRIIGLDLSETLWKSYACILKELSFRFIDDLESYLLIISL